MIRKIILLLLSLAVSVQADCDWSRYEVIVNRSPFGKEPPLSEPAEAVRPAGEFAKQYRLCMLYEDAQGELKAGIVSKVDNKNFFLQVGESEKGLSLLDVRLEEGIAVLQQGGDTAELLLEGLGTRVASVSQVSAAVASISGPAPQQIRRAGSQSAPEHILAALTDAEPKQAKITVRKKDLEEFGEGSNHGTAESSDLSKRSEVSEESMVNRYDAGSPAVGKLTGGAHQTLASANYLIQSVPQRYNPF